MRLEFETEKRRALVWEFQRYEAKMQYFPRFPGGASSFHLSQPAVRNRLVYQGGTWRNYYEWIDSTKPPLGNR